LSLGSKTEVGLYIECLCRGSLRGKRPNSVEEVANAGFGEDLKLKAGSSSELVQEGEPSLLRLFERQSLFKLGKSEEQELAGYALLVAERHEDSRWMELEEADCERRLCRERKDDMKVWEVKDEFRLRRTRTLGYWCAYLNCTCTII
jgi:hypothetical protein